MFTDFASISCVGRYFTMGTKNRKASECFGTHFYLSLSLSHCLCFDLSLSLFAMCVRVSGYGGSLVTMLTSSWVF